MKLWQNKRAFTKRYFNTVCMFVKLSLETAFAKEESPVLLLCCRWRASSKFRKAIRARAATITPGSNVIHQTFGLISEIFHWWCYVTPCNLSQGRRKNEKKRRRKKRWLNLSTAYVCLLIFSNCLKGKSVKSWDCEIVRCLLPPLPKCLWLRCISYFTCYCLTTS